jgi:hypothetical protein
MTSLAWCAGLGVFVGLVFALMGGRARRQKTTHEDFRIAFYGGPLAGQTKSASSRTLVGDLIPAAPTVTQHAPEVQYEVTEVDRRVGRAIATWRGE